MPTIPTLDPMHAPKIRNNIFGIDIDLRAVQLSALALYLRAKRMNKNAQIKDHNLSCADVLPFSSADLGRFIIEMKFSNPIFEKMLRRIIGEHIEFSVILSKTTPVVLADSNQIIQVLINLATNARDAMPKGGKVTIRTETVENPDASAAGENGERQDGRYALLSFEDTGEGMDESMVDKIFDPFFTTKEPGKASGLGLATIYGIVKQQKGFISVQTNVGSGTTFNIYLPLVDIPVDTREAIRLAAHLRGTETILVCEDETDIRNFIREILESNGYTVIEAKDGEEGIDTFRRCRDKVALVLLDVMMPKKSGKDVYDSIVELDPKVKTIFMTGYSADSLDKQGFGDAITPCIFKPIETDMLLTEIRKKLDEEKIVQELKSSKVQG